MVRVGGAGAGHDLIGHLPGRSHGRKTTPFTCGRTIRRPDEDAIRLLPAGAWKPGTVQDGVTEEGKDVA